MIQRYYNEKHFTPMKIAVVCVYASTIKIHEIISSKKITGCHIDNEMAYIKIVIYLHLMLWLLPMEHLLLELCVWSKCISSWNKIKKVTKWVVYQYRSNYEGIRTTYSLKFLLNNSFHYLLSFTYGTFFSHCPLSPLVLESPNVDPILFIIDSHMK